MVDVKKGLLKFSDLTTPTARILTFFKQNHTLEVPLRLCISVGVKERDPTPFRFLLQ